MLKQLRLANFKAFGAEQAVDLAPVTLIYGPNSGGKSSLIHALTLMFLKQSLSAGRPVVRGPLIDLGSYGAMVHRHYSKHDIVLSVAFEPRSQDDYGQSTLLSGFDQNIFRMVTARFGEDRRGPRHHSTRVIVRETRYAIGSSPLQPIAFVWKETNVEAGGVERFVIRDADAANGLASLTKLFYEKLPAESKSKGADSVRRRGMAVRQFAKWLVGQMCDAGSYLKLRLLPSEVADPWHQYSTGRHFHKTLKAPRIPEELGGCPFLSGLVSEFEMEFATLRHLGPLRARPQRLYTNLELAGQGVGPAGEHALEVLSNDSAVLEMTNDWLKRFEIPYRLQVDAFDHPVAGHHFVLTLIDAARKVRAAPSDVGFGISQLLPIIVEGQLATAVLCVEQPEIHLHPRLQAHLADLFLDTAGVSLASQIRAHKDWRPRTQWVVETHSEAIMHRIQRRVREGQVSPNDVCVLYVEPRTEGGSRVTRLRLDDYGEFVDEWPGGFFEEGLRELTVTRRV